VILLIGLIVAAVLPGTLLAIVRGRFAVLSVLILSSMILGYFSFIFFRTYGGNVEGGYAIQMFVRPFIGIAWLGVVVGLAVQFNRHFGGDRH
jgi:hypothetical protein